MKWKLTGRYIFSILSIVFIVLVVNASIVLAMLIHQRFNDEEDISTDRAESFTREFSQYFMFENGQPTISQQGQDALIGFGAWLQILDENGEVISSFDAPESASMNYSPIELIHKYKYMDDEFNTYFIGAYEEYSYIIGMRFSDERRFVFTIDLQSFFSNATLAFFIIVIVNFIIAASIGLLFSSILTRPVHIIIKRISQLNQRQFNEFHPNRPGIFNSVFANLNNLSNTLKKQEEDQSKLEKMRNEWISNVTHDLKTPLSSIQGYAELLREHDITKDERLEYSEVIERQSIYMRNLLDDLNLTIRLRNQEMPLSVTETNIEKFVREMIIDILNSPSFQDRNEISFSSEAENVYLSIDKHLLKRALLNFIQNAFVHNDANVLVSLVITDDYMVIEDNGKGIKSEDLEQIFERYYRGTNTEHIQGTGLGMAIARDIIEAHGGKVEITSQHGKGTSIRIWFENMRT
ncbi:sensor histidine kinase [Alkalihalobacillus trypoxylicola]|uniref:histidine kinase n=1 Tax=Alkalihalobacillus trypoxylicola TaxID=519424 RepID=A0A162DE85_9BACI|nr:HAMP domain-containing sensor histidine kinase [Alkalihalobacillus trypoxylicola]KYG29350.1 histidine kinase [Alkalihalobacillus trypoxylicola]